VAYEYDTDLVIVGLAYALDSSIVFSRIGKFLATNPIVYCGWKEIANTSFLCLGDEYLITGFLLFIELNRLLISFQFEKYIFVLKEIYS